MFQPDFVAETFASGTESGGSDVSGRAFEPLALPFEHSSSSNTGRELFLGLRPVPGDGA
jgi:hypothetical protein